MVVLWSHCQMILQHKASKPAFFLILCLLGNLLYSSYSLADSEQLLKKQELLQLRQKIKTLQQNLKKQQGEKTQLQQEIKKSEQMIADNGRQYYETQSQIKTISQKISHLNKAVVMHNKKLIVQQQLLSEQIETSYAIGRQEYLKLLLNQQDISSISRVMVYYKYFNEARQRQIETVNLLLRELEDDKFQISFTSQALWDKQGQLQREKQALDDQQQQRNNLVAKLDKNIHSKGKELVNLQENEKNLIVLLKKLKQW